MSPDLFFHSVNASRPILFFSFTILTDFFYDALNLMASLISLVFAVPFEKYNLAAIRSIAMRQCLNSNTQWKFPFAHSATEYTRTRKKTKKNRLNVFFLFSRFN